MTDMLEYAKKLASEPPRLVYKAGCTELKNGSGDCAWLFDRKSGGEMVVRRVSPRAEM